MKKLVEDLPFIDIKDIKRILAGCKERHRIEIKISDKYAQVVVVASTPGNFGGSVYWFICPGCKRRVKRIYLSTQGNVFLCRNCQDLAYRTQNLREFRKTKYLRKIKAKDDLEEIIKSREKLMKKLLDLKRF
jgi:hypothetical protein